MLRLITFHRPGVFRSCDLHIGVTGLRPPSPTRGWQKWRRRRGLQELWLPRNDTGITEEKINELKALMPKTEVIAYTVEWE